ncbi:hypothetical protein J7E29_16655 [Streptomyces sp. ISL-90]|nr:hypothetical protein [Streptomyces sp. ISL-90]
MGGGASEDPAAAARINALLTDIPNDYQATGQEALDYANRLATLFPALGPAFSKISVATGCAFSSGVLGAKAYATPDLRAAGVMLIVSGKQLQNLSAIAFDCLVNEVVSEVFGGGPVGGFNPCFDSYQLDANVDGVDDRFYVFTAGTNQETCQYLRNSHIGLGLQPTPIG